MDWDFMAKYAPMYGRAAGLTLRIAALGIVFSLAVGVLCCTVRRFRTPVLARLAGAYIELARNTPLLIQLFFLYFGLPKIGIRWEAETCAVIGLSFLGGASIFTFGIRGGVAEAHRFIDHPENGFAAVR